MARVAEAVPHTLVTAYEMVVEPAAIPLTTPAVLTVPAAVLELLHAPPPVASLKVIVAFVHTALAPVIEPALGSGLTTIACVAVALPQLAVVAL